MENITNNIFDIGESEFNEKVIEASSSGLVIVDFWAPWCEPCKQLTPILEKIINKANGKVSLVKINIDENQTISSQLRVQSIPAVYAFKNGQPVDAFQGVIPEKKIIEFIEKSLGEKINKDNAEFYKSINNLIEVDECSEAASKLEDFIADNPDELKSFGLYIDCLSSLKKFDDAENFYKSLDKDIASNSIVNSSYQRLKIIIKSNDGPSLEQIKKDYETDPNNLKIILILSKKYFSENMIDDAFNLLLQNYDKNKISIKSAILEYFDLLGNDNNKTKEYRKKLSSIFFS